MTQHSSTHHIPCDPYEQDFENGTLRRVHDPKPEPLPEGSAVAVLIFLHIVGALVILAGAAIYATRIF